MFALDSIQIDGEVRSFSEGFLEATQEILEERIISLIESSVQIRSARTPEDLEISVESSCITLEEQAEFFEEFLFELQKELFERENTVIQTAWELAENNLSKVDQANELEPLEVRALLSEAIEDTRQFFQYAELEMPSDEEFETQLRKVVEVHRRHLLDWYRINATINNLEERINAAEIKKWLDYLADAAKRLQLRIRSAPKDPVPVHIADETEILQTEKISSVVNVKPQKPLNKPSKLNKLKVQKVAAKKSLNRQVPAKPRSKKVFTKKYWEFLREDYYKYHQIWNRYSKDIRNNEERNKLHELLKVLSSRRAELVDWEKNQSFLGSNPVSLKEEFAWFREIQKIEPAKSGVEKRMADILKDLDKNPGHRSTVRFGADINRRIFLTAGRENPRAKKIT